MKLTAFIALRYFTGERKGASFLSFAKIISVAGVAVGSAGLLIALSIVHGFKSTIEEKIIGFGSHISITTMVDEPIYRADSLVTYLSSEPLIEMVQPVVMGQVMIQHKQAVEGTFLKGVPESGDVTDLRSYISSGSYNLATGDDGVPSLVIGARLAKSLGAEAGDMITVYSVSGLPSSGNLPDIRRFRVGGIYQTGIDRFDDVFVLGSLDVVRQLVGVEYPAAHSIDIRLKDVSQIRTLEAALDTVVPFPYLVETVYLRYANIFAWIRLQEQTVPLVIGVMILIAAFNLIGTVLMMVLERVRDIGILKTMGATQVQIRRIFLAEGMIVGVVGLVIGISIAVLFSWVQGTYGIIPLDQENYYMSKAPVEPKMIDYFWVSGVTMLLCMAASWLPSNVAAKINPLNVIQFGR